MNNKNFLAGFVPRQKSARELLVLALIVSLVIGAIIFVSSSGAGQLFRQDRGGSQIFKLEDVSGFKAFGSGEADFSCPVSSDSCRTAVKVSFHNRPAVAYALDPGAEIKSIGRGVAKGFSTDPLEALSFSGFWQAITAGDSCYTATYIFPPGTQIKKGVEFEKGESIAFVGDGFIKIGEKEARLIMQIQRRKTEGGSSSCAPGDLQPVDFGEYLTFDGEAFR